MNAVAFNLMLFSLAIVAFSSGCSTRATSQQPASAANATDSAAHGPQLKPGEAAVPTSGAPGVPALAGTYTIAEVEHKGTVNMIPPSFATTITFMPDGSFSRVSKKKGKLDHSDNGTFQIERKAGAGQQLVLKTIFANNQGISSPNEKRHDFTLSADGEELRLVGTDGKVAIFRRTVSLPGK